MEYADIRGERGRSRAHEPTAVSHSASHAEQRGPAQRTSTLSKELDRLVGGTLTAQEYGDRLETLTRTVQASDEKVFNLTRLVKLSQSIQEEKEAELRSQNEEFRARLKRQEQLTAQLQRQLEDVQSAVKSQNTMPTAERIDGLLKAHKEQQKERLGALQQRLSSLEESVQSWRTNSVEHYEQRIAQLEKNLQHVAQSTVGATTQWAKRNFLRFKEHVDALRADIEDVRGGQRDLQSTVDNTSCRAEEEYKKLLNILQQKTTEADALSALVEKELHHLQKVAHRHQILASKDITPTFQFDERPYHALKFNTSEKGRRGELR